MLAERERERVINRWQMSAIVALFAFFTFLLLFTNFNCANAQEVSDIKTSKSVPALEQILRLELTTTLTADSDQEISTDGSRVAMFRLYNKWTGEHFYTSSKSERDEIAEVGWTYEQIEWYAPTSEDFKPVYRLYNSFVEGGDHHYTTSADEKDECIKAGWRYEGEGWRTVDEGATDYVKVLRQYNPYGATGTHNYTTDEDEQKYLVSLGWRAEADGGWGGYSKLEPSADPTPTPSSTFTVTFNTNGGSAVATQTVQSGKTATKPADPTKNGYTFAGWFTDSALTKSFNFSTPIIANTTLYAKWTEVVTTFTVTFNTNGGSAVATQTVQNGKTAVEPKDPTKQGYTFDGWFSDSGLTKSFDFSAPIVSNITLYAKWTESAEWLTVTFNTNGGSDIEALAVQYGKTATKPTDPVKAGFTFEGWFSDSELTKAFDFATPIVANTTLYAKWKEGYAFAVYSADDNSLNFYRRKTIPADRSIFNGKTVTQVYLNIEKDNYIREWDGRTDCTSVVFVDEIQPKNLNAWFNGFQNLVSVDMANLDTSNVTNMSEMFRDCKALTSLNVANFNTSNVINMSNMFRNCRALTSLNVANFDTSKVLNMSEMFRECRELTGLNLSNFDTSKVLNMREMFFYCWKLKSLLVSSFDTSKVTDMCGMFQSCSSLESLDVSSFNTSSVTSMSSMFSGCRGLSSLIVSNFNTSSVTNMDSMFANSTLKELDVSKFDVSNVTSMVGMFSFSYGLSELDLSTWKVTKVENMSSMFSGCTVLTKLNLSNWDTSSATNMSWMFESCEGLKDLDVSSFKTSKVKDMYGMFGSCGSLESLDVSSFNTSNVTKFDNMFEGCTGLTTLAGVSAWDTSNVISMSNVFKSCSALTVDCSAWDVKKVTNHTDFATDALNVTEPEWVVS